MHVITFYSFKGGVGRTMALVNVAAEMVRRGRTVLVVDFDLEAPGLETYSPLQPDEPHPGMVEYVTEFMNSGVEVPDIRKFVYEAKYLKFKKKEDQAKAGKLWVMPAGRRTEVAYRRALVNLNWKRLYFERDGFLFFEETKAAWEQEFKPDYVLIDSRTGDTDVLGICTRQLPDSVVLLFVPNEQNIAGLEGVCRDIRREKTEGLKKDIRLHFVPSNIPNLDDEDQILRRQLRDAVRRLKIAEDARTRTGIGPGVKIQLKKTKVFSGIIRRYESLELLDQSIAVIDHPRSRLAKTYRQLVRMLAIENYKNDRDGALLFLDEYAKELAPRIEFDLRAALNRQLRIEDESANKSPDYFKGFDHADGEAKKKDPLNQIANNDQFRDDTKILNKIVACRILRGDFRSALSYLEQILEDNPNQPDLLFWCGQCKRNLNRPDEAVNYYLRCLRLPNKEWRDVMRVLHALRDITPDRLGEATELLGSQGPDPFVLREVVDFLCATEDGIALAANLLRKVIQSHRKVAGIRPPLDLLRKARCWSEIVESYETGTSDELDYFDFLQIGIAYWARDEVMPKNICELALQREQDFGTKPEAAIWLHWGAGLISTALEWLDAAEEYEQREFAPGSILPPGTPLWGQTSPWSLSEVGELERYSGKDYLEDCQKVRRFIQGEPLRPAFLGPLLGK